MKNIYPLIRGITFLCLIHFVPIQIAAQEIATNPEKHTYKPLTLKLDESGKKYLRFIMWHQLWLTTNNLDADGAKLQITPSIRRSRFLAFAQISPKFMLLTHFGLNSLNPSNLSALGTDSNTPQLFLHGAWGELKINDQLYLGSGLHYWKGLTRLASQSTLNFMTLDQARPFAQWHSLGITDQFARHLGVYAKGQIKKLDYRIAFNAPGRNPLAAGQHFGSEDVGWSYTGVSNPDKDGNPTGNLVMEGYFRYNFWDKESIKLPYNVGTYLGKKKILAIGTGFFLHPNGMFDDTTADHGNVSHFAADAFFEYPTAKGDCVHFYGSLINFNYGRNYVSRWGGTGTNLYGQFGYYLKSLKMMPYIAFQNGDYEGLEEPVNSLDIGLNYYINGHHAKLTMEYHRIQGDIRESAIATGDDALSQLRFQLHIFL